MCKKLLYLLAFVLLLGTFSAPVLATDYYLDAVNGDDDTGDGSLNDPWETFANCIYYYSSGDRPSGWVSLQPGDTVQLKNGTYDTGIDPGGGYEDAIASFRSIDGTSANPITIKAYSDHSPVLDGNNSRAAIRIWQSDYWAVDGLIVEDCYGRGITFSEGTGFTLSNTHIYDTDGLNNTNVTGLELKSTDNAEVYDCVFNDNYDRTGGGTTENSTNMVIFSDYGQTNDIIIHDCEFYQTRPTSQISGAGLRYKHASKIPTSTFEVYNCTFDNHKFFHFGTGTANTHFHHNLITGGAVSILDKNMGGTTHQTDQLFEYNTIYGTNGFALKATDSYVNEDFPDDPTGIVYRSNIVYDTTASYGTWGATIIIDNYLQDDLYDEVVAALSFSNNCYYNPNRACKFNFAAAGWASGGGEFTLSEWETEYGYDSNSVEDDPCFVDAANGDFSLQSGSPAAGMGMYGDVNQPPGQASSPSPANSATGISTTADLSWTAGSGATSHDVYFGTDSTPDSSEDQGNQTATTFDPGTMSNSTTYYWRIDEINGEGTTTGDVWSFTTTSGSAPGAASSPSPANSATSVSITADLSWTAGSGATSRDVYFGTSSPGASQGNQTATTFDAGTMSNNTTYYWRIDEVNGNGTTTGTVWSFTTQSPASGTVLLVDFGDTANEDTFELTDWDTAITDTYTNNVDIGPGGTTITVASNPGYDYQGVTGTSRSFVADEIIRVTWYNNSASQVTFTPRMSFTDSNRPLPDTDWDDMSQTVIAAYGTGTSEFTVDANSAGTYSVVNVNVNYSNNQVLICDKIELVTGSTPGQATNPSPANSATDVSITADLSWTADANATSHDVYFGTSSPGASQGNQAATTFDTGTMTNNTTYYWRIDEVNAGGTTTGTVWSFTTIVAAPGAASSPSPANSATGVSITADLSWSAGSGATSRDVYFGTSSPGASQGNQTATTFDTGTMANDTTYFWRIDEVNAGGTTTGTV
ncbi:MAG: right-handed parallel beta-helix repeat-containing protein, partial [Planctomycetota bacterium]